MLGGRTSDRRARQSMFLLGILGGWLALSCAAAPFIGHFVALNAIPVDSDPRAAQASLQPAQGL